MKKNSPKSYERRFYHTPHASNTYFQNVRKLDVSPVYAVDFSPVSDVIKDRRKLDALLRAILRNGDVDNV